MDTSQNGSLNPLAFGAPLLRGSPFAIFSRVNHRVTAEERGKPWDRQPSSCPVRVANGCSHRFVIESIRPVSPDGAAKNSTCYTDLSISFIETGIGAQKLQELPTRPFEARFRDGPLHLGVEPLHLREADLMNFRLIDEHTDGVQPCNNILKVLQSELRHGADNICHGLMHAANLGDLEVFGREANALDGPFVVAPEKIVTELLRGIDTLHPASSQVNLCNSSSPLNMIPVAPACALASAVNPALATYQSLADMAFVLCMNASSSFLPMALPFGWPLLQQVPLKLVEFVLTTRENGLVFRAIDVINHFI